MKTNYEAILGSFLQMPCCNLATAAIDYINERERRFFKTFMPGAKTAIVLGYHVTKKAEWTWYAKKDGGERCDADDHSADLCHKIKGKLETRGCAAKIVPYPGECGLQFRFVAQSAGLGTIGKNAFLLHPEWGPWIHLRVIATEASFERYSQPVNSVCTECGRCVEACPAKAITDDSFDGLTCRSYRKSKGEYTPFGPKREVTYCDVCAQVCPTGDVPKS